MWLTRCISVAVALFVIHSFWKHERRAGQERGQGRLTSIASRLIAMIRELGGSGLPRRSAAKAGEPPLPINS
jgi:hypothetical protein